MGKTVKRLISALLAAAMIISVVPAIAAAPYTEVVYIKTAEDLLAIDGHSGGYYELQNNIDISGMEWRSIYIPGGTFNGNGHSISGMTVTQTTDRLGLFYSGLSTSSTYVYDLTLDKINIDAEYTGYYNAESVLGSGSADSCVVSGSVRLKLTKGHSYWPIAGIVVGTNCTAELDIDIDARNYSDILTVCGIYNSSGSKFVGDIDVDITDSGIDEFWTYGILNSPDSEMYGDINVRGNDETSAFTTSAYVAAISRSDNCGYYGDVTTRGIYETHGIDYGSNDMFNGNINVSAGIVDGISGETANRIYIENSDCFIGDITVGTGTACAIVGGNNQSFDGNLTVMNGSAYGLSTGKDNTMNGNVTVNKGSALGIGSGENNCLTGNITSANGSVSGISLGENNIIRGNLTSNNGNAEGIAGTDERNILNGNITANNGEAEGMHESSGHITGTITENPKEYPSMTVSAEDPFKGYYKCEYCGETIISEHLYDDWSYVHCYTYDSYGSSEEHYYNLVNDLYYTYPMDYEAPPEGEAPPPIYPTLPPASYAVQVVEAKGGEPLEGAIVTIGGEEYTTDGNGVINLSGAPRTGGLKIEYGGSVVYTKTDFCPAPNRMNVIKVSPLNLEPEDFFAGNNASVQLEGPSVTVKDKQISAFAMPFDFELALFDKVKLAYDSDEDKYQVLFGNNKELDNIPENAQDNSWEDIYDNYKDAWEHIKDGAVNDDVFKHINSSPKGSLGLSGNMYVAGFMELSLDTDGIHVESGGVTVVLTGGMENSVSFAPPLYLAYGISGELDGQFKVTPANDASAIDPGFDIAGEISAALSPKAGLGIGLRKLLSLEVGLEGELGGKITFPMTTPEKTFEASLEGSFYAMYNVLALEFKQSQKILDFKLYPRTAAASLMSIDSGDMRLVHRDYLDAPMPMLADTDTVKQNIYPYSSVKLVMLSDGRELMVWLDDDADRISINRTALYYSILENGTWSTPAQIESDGTADFDFDLQANGDDAVIVWQDANTRLADTASLSEIAAAIDLSYAEFNGDIWSTPTAITSGNSNYEYSPRAAQGHYGTYIIWSQNDKNSAEPAFDDATESIYRTYVMYGEVQESEQVYSGIKLLYDSAVDTSGNVVYIADADGDISTLENKYFASNKQYGGDTVLSGLQYVDGKFAFTEDGVLKTADAYGSQPRTQCSPGGESIAYLANSYGRIGAAVYEVQDGFTSNLYASYYDNSEWTNPVKITDFDEKIRSWDAYLDEDGNIVLSAVLAKINVDGDNVTDSVRLVHTKAEPIEDIEVKGVFADGDIVRGKNAQFNVYVVNNTKSAVKKASVTLKCGDTVLYEAETDVNLTAGETTGISVTASIPDDFAGGTITASVSVPDLTESDTDNNSAQTVVSGAKLNVELNGNQICGSGYAQAVIENVSCEDVSNAALTVTGENGDEIYSETIDSIAAGETKRVKIELDEKYYTFTDDYDSFAVKASVKYGENEETDTYRIKPQSVMRVSLNEDSVVLSTGESCQINADLYPAGTSADIYVLSSDESVVTTDGTTITAVGEGTATVSVMAVGAIVSAKLTVYVHNFTAPVITSAQYTDYSDEYSVYGNVNVTVDTSACLAEGETETLIAAVYAEDGSLLGVQTNDVQASGDNNVYMSVSGKKPKYVKTMLWSSLSGMKPAALAARYDLSE